MRTVLCLRLSFYDINTMLGSIKVKLSCMVSSIVLIELTIQTNVNTHFLLLRPKVTLCYLIFLSIYYIYLFSYLEARDHSQLTSHS